MSPTFWRQIHGGSTHLPIVLLLASAVFDFVAWRARDEALRRGLHTAGFGSAVVGMLGGMGAVIAGLVMTHGRILGGGYEKTHHLFVWPALALSVVLVGWRLLKGGRTPRHGLGVYLTGMAAASMLMLGAGYSGGEMLLATENEAVGELLPSNLPTATLDQTVHVTTGQKLFLKNCAHCHGAEAHGDEGPDLHNLDWTDEQIATRIRNGKKGQMTAFAGKFSADDIRAVIAYLRILK
jgi:mono/diheme cytochrome c family protein